jgi:1-acyl-sn-glycerol-3-phosphate acyltransferase
MRDIILFPYRIYAALLLIFIILLFFPLILLSMLLGIDIGGKIIFALVRFMSRIWFLLIGIIHRTQNRSNHEKHCIYVANHRSYIDGICTFLTVNGQFRVLGKAEVNSIPVFGFLYRYAVILVNRSSKKNRTKSIEVLKKVLNHYNISIFIFPEGTFTKDNEVLSKFYDGAFRIAIETQTDIQPLVIIGADKCLPGNTYFKISPGIITTYYLDKISIKHYESENDIEKLKDIVFQKIKEGIIKYSS